MAYKTFRRNVKRVTRKTFRKPKTVVRTRMRVRSTRKRSRPEIKEAIFKQEGVSFNSTINSQADLQQLLPSVTAGTGDGQRVGRRIRPVSLTVRGYMSYDAFTTSTVDVGPLECHLFAIRTKNTRCAVNLTSADTYFLDDAGEGRQWDSSITRSLLPVLRSNYTQLGHKRSKLACLGAGGVSIDYTAPTYVRFTMKIKIKQELHYSEASNMYPDNWCGFITGGFVDPRRQTQLDGTRTPFKLSYTSILKYIDQ